MANVDESRWLERALRGDRQAFSDLLQANSGPVRREIAARLPVRWRSLLSEDDVMQQTYADAFRGIHQFVPRGPGAFRAWLLALARCNLLDAVKALRSDKRGGSRQRLDASNEESFVGLLEQLTGDLTTPSRHAARLEAHEELKRSLSALPDAYRQVIQMYDLQGWPAQEVAAVLRRSVGAVYMLRARAHDQLRNDLGTASRFLE